MRREQLYPIPNVPGRVDRWFARAHTSGPMRCPVCGRVGLVRGLGENLRETGRCTRCGSTNRNRQLASVTLRAAAELIGRRFRSLAAVADTNLAIYNTEAQGPIHDVLHGAPGYRCSEYLGPEHAPGAIVDGVAHEDIMALSFADESLDLVLSSDVFEHVPDPYRGHGEVRRVLRPGGRHVFTVPFHQHSHHDDVRARPTADGTPDLLAEAIYHDDPVRPEGVLVYTIFGLEMLVKLADVGFDTRFYALWEPWHGIVGPNALVFEAVKVVHA